MMVLRKWSDRRRTRIIAQEPAKLIVRHGRTYDDGEYTEEIPAVFVMRSGDVEVSFTKEELSRAFDWFTHSPAYNPPSVALAFWRHR